MKWLNLHQRLWLALLKQERALTRRVVRFFNTLLRALKKSAYRIDASVDAAIRHNQDSLDPVIRDAIRTGAGIVASAAVPSAERAAFIERGVALEMTTHALPERLADLNATLRADIERVLESGVRMERAVSAIVQDMQRAIDARMVTRSAIVTADSARWVKGLAEAGRAVILNPEMRQSWLRTVAKTEAAINQLTSSATGRGARELLSSVTEAVSKGRIELVDQALKARALDKQLYRLKTMARTATANAHHAAILRATWDTPEVIGYRWRLSGRHPKHAPDICDELAHAQLGLGVGVWPRERVPRQKAHPNCLCTLIPVRTPTD